MMDAMFEIPSGKPLKTLSINLEYALAKFEKSDLRKLKVA
jgi:ATP-dependent Clp protease ATP-binding subunit ClpX